jgi:hypothetical protein
MRVARCLLACLLLAAAVLPVSACAVRVRPARPVLIL